jgi:hypothetical protein
MGNRIVISESQYSRLFLNEQQIEKIKSNGNYDYRQLDNRLLKPLSPYASAQEQWARLGADNPKTGRNIIPDNTVKYYKDLYDQGIENVNKTVGEKPVDWYSSPEAINIGMDSNRPSNFNQNWQSEPTKWEKRKSSEVESTVDKSYYDILEYNKNIKSQPKLIPQYCKKPNVIKHKMDWICGTGECDEVSDYRMNELKKKRDKYGGEFGWYGSNPKTMRKYGYYLKYSVNVGETPFKHCNTETLKGVWVYKFESGYHCGCYEMDNQKYLIQDNGIFVGTHSTNAILGLNQKLRDYEISKQPGFLDSVTQWAGGCFEDYHCVLDILSIAALAVPGVGLALSAGFDFVNGISYGVEAYNAETSEDKYAAILAGGLTMFGGIMGGGVKQTNKILKYGAANPKIFEYASDVMSSVQKEYKGVKKLKSIDPDKGLNVLGKKVDPKLSEIYGQAANKYGLSEKEVLMAHDLLKNFSKIDPAIAKQYSEALSALESKIQKGNLVLLGKHKGLKTAIDASGGDVVVGLKKYMGKVARKEAVMEASLFVILTEAMEQPAVQKWIADKYTMLKYSGRKDIRGMVEKEGYEWDSTKKQFYSTSTGTDNDLLKMAWLKGWRPDKDETKTIEWLIKNPKYQTKTFKSLLSKPKRIAALRSDDPDFVEKEGVVYLDNEDDVWMTNASDGDITGEDLDATTDKMNELLGI